MDDISKLLQEAKPLYFARKKRKRRLFAATAASACLGLLLFWAPHPSGMDTAYVSYGEWMEDWAYQTAEGSLIEEMGLPVDDYGLLKVI